MENFITIKTFTYPVELAVLQGRLESEGIECRVLDELTVQVNPFYSHAIGGIKLQVKENDIQKAIEILKEGGYLKDKDLQPPKDMDKLEHTTSRIPFLKNLRLEFRLIIIVSIIVLVALILSGLIYFISSPSTFERLTKQSWRIDQVVHNGEAYTTNTVEQIQLVMAGYCEEKITMDTYGTIRLPGFNSRAVWGKWELEDDLLQISQVDSFGFIYDGVYKIDFFHDELILKSEQTTLYCYPQNLYVNLPF